MAWLRRLCVKESFHEATTDLRVLLNLAPSDRVAEQMNQRMAQDAEIFQVHQSPPEPDIGGDTLVATADGMGVPMRRPPEERMHRSHPRVPAPPGVKKAVPGARAYPPWRGVFPASVFGDETSVTVLQLLGKRADRQPVSWP